VEREREREREGEGAYNLVFESHSLFNTPLSSSRFYFVGDEDLLEIIGNSKNVPKLQKHFKKMFAGVATVILSEDETRVLGICSKEGEEVRDSLFHTLSPFS
jgi:hypothetical protein